MQAMLIEKGSGKTFEIDEFALVGRGENATIKLTDGSISRQHATIRREHGHFRLVDLGSANGTYVNGVALTGARVLFMGDRIQFGSTELVFQQSEAVELPGFNLDGRTQIARSAPAPMRNSAVTLMVADLKGFTQMSTMISPGEVADLLREWYADCTAILSRNGASLDKFIGDCFFAYWHGTDATVRQKALKVARELRSIEHDPTTPVRIDLRNRHAIRLDTRVGIHLGQVALGAMGTGVNTALGDAVNVTFRIESLTRELGQTTLASGAFLDGWPDGAALFDPCGRHQLKGFSEPMEIFALKDV